MVPNVLVTFPGKIGDALMQWPLAYWYWKETGNKFHVIVGQTLEPLVPLLETQEPVIDVKVLPRIEHYKQGGQPWDFKLTEDEKKEYDEIHHLGFRTLPDRQLTLYCRTYAPVKPSDEQLSEPSIFVGEGNRKSLLIVHGTAFTHAGIREGTDLRPRVWDVYGTCEQFFRHMFDRVVFIGNDKDRITFDREGYEGEWFEDGGNFLTLAYFMKDAAFVLGAGSCGVVLAGALGVPSLRVHDLLWGEEDFTFWSNIGKLQANYYPQGAIQREKVRQFVEEVCLDSSAKSQ